MDMRRLVISDANHQTLKMIDVSDLDNANSAAPLRLTVEARCDMGHWHMDSHYELAPWGTAIRPRQ